ncbi:MAG: M48 family metallopeptidase [Erysipelotrichaceae bacterium]
MLENFKYPVVVQKSKRKTLSLEVKAGKVFVKCDYRVSNQEILELLQKKEQWLDKRLANYDPDSFYLLGQKYQIVRKKGPNDYFLSNNQLFIYGDEKYLIDKIYLDHQDIILNIAEKCLKNFEVQPSKISIKRLKRTLGICHKDGSISLSLTLSKYHPDVISMIVYHELSHLLHFNHSKAFYNCLSRYCPNHRELKQITREY